MVGLYRTNVLVLPFLFRVIAFSHQASLYKGDKSKDKSVNGLSVSKSFVPTVLALVLSVGLCVLGWAIPEAELMTTGKAPFVMGEPCGPPAVPSQMCV